MWIYHQFFQDLLLIERKQKKIEMFRINQTFNMKKMKDKAIQSSGGIPARGN